MLIKLKKKIKGQSTAEYAILIALVVGAITGMQVYVTRAINAGVKGKTDEMSTEMGSATTQYEPYYHVKVYEQERNATQYQDYDADKTEVGETTYTKRASDGYTLTTDVNGN